MRVHACALNPNGLSGTVDAIGKDVTNILAGDRVCGVPDYMGYPTAGAPDYAILARLSRIGNFPFAGALPEAAAFGDRSRFLAVTSFDHLPPQVLRGSVDFWRIASDFPDSSRVELAPTGYSIPIARGAQAWKSCVERPGVTQAPRTAQTSRVAAPSRSAFTG